MLPAILFLVILVICFVVVRVGALLLKMTGLPWDEARFQALSAFTNTGFTTKRAERITEHPVRRNIASILIVLGYAGLATLVGTFAGTIFENQSLQSISAFLVIVSGVVLLLWLVERQTIAARFYVKVERWLRAHYDFDTQVPEELLRLDKGFCLTKIFLDEQSPAVGATLSQLRLKQHTVQLLAIERGHNFIPVPRGDQALKAGDKLIVYGARKEIEKILKPEHFESLVISADSTETSSSQ